MFISKIFHVLQNTSDNNAITNAVRKLYNETKSTVKPGYCLQFADDQVILNLELYMNEEKPHYFYIGECTTDLHVGNNDIQHGMRIIVIIYII